MKRFFAFAVAAILCAAPLYAQPPGGGGGRPGGGAPAGGGGARGGVNVGAVQGKIDASNEEIANSRRNTRTATWLTRGDVFYEAATTGTSNIFAGMDKATFDMLHRNPQSSEQVVIGGQEYTKLTFPAFVAYFSGNTLMMFENTLKFTNDDLGTAVEAYLKAVELDSKSAAKAKEGLKKIADEYQSVGGSLFSLTKYNEAAVNFEKAYEVSILPVVNEPDYMSLYNAGFIYALAENFQKGAEALKRAADAGFENDGETYYYLYYCYYNLGDYEKAKDALITAHQKYPENEKIVEGLVGLYSSVEGYDIEEITDILDEAIKENPNNPGLWSGLGLIYNKLGDYDKSIEAFRTAIQYAPEDYGLNYNVGFLLIRQADEMGREVNAAGYTNQQELDAALAGVEQVYMDSVPYLERAHELDPANADAVELLKNVSFRLREKPGMMEKYEKYDALFKSM